MLKTARTVVFWNPSAGSAERAVDIRQMLESMPNVTIREPDGREAAIEATVQAAESGVELIVAAGGDGTVSSVAEGLGKSSLRPVFGVLPLGTGNDLARSLGVPLPPTEALASLADGRVTGLDLVQFTTSDESRTYVNMLTGGNTGRCLQHMTADLKQLWGPFCYLRGVIDVVLDMQVYDISVTCDDGTPQFYQALNIFVANGRYSGGGLEVSPGADLHDGLVDVVIVRDGDPGEIAELTTQYAFADYLQHELIAFHRVHRLAISSDPPLPLTADGDSVGETPLEATVQQSCIDVLMPQQRSVESVGA